jgi:hypothetical protein
LIGSGQQDAAGSRLTNLAKNFWAEFPFQPLFHPRDGNVARRERAQAAHAKPREGVRWILAEPSLEVGRRFHRIADLPLIGRIAFEVMKRGCAAVAFFSR